VHGEIALPSSQAVPWVVDLCGTIVGAIYAFFTVSPPGRPFQTVLGAIVLVMGVGWVLGGGSLRPFQRYDLPVSLLTQFLLWKIETGGVNHNVGNLKKRTLSNSF
jgi:hypothetical protein